MLTTQTRSAKTEEADRKWVVIDADGAVVGRLASFVAMRLRGKHRPDFTPHADVGDYVVVVNAARAVFTGKKMTDKIYYRHTGHPGGIKEASPRMLHMRGQPSRILELAVKRMLPKESPLARAQFAKLRVYPGPEHPHAAQMPETVDFKAMNRKNARGG